jgi:integrase
VAGLKAQRVRQAEVRLAVGSGYRDEGYVFAGPAGEPLNPATVSRLFTRFVARLGRPRLTVHGLRHTWATVALGSGVPAKVASEVLGHSSIAVTLDTYSHALPSMQEAATQAVADRIFGSR